MNQEQNNLIIDNVINNENMLEEKLLKAFIGKNYEKIIQKKFSILALFLSWIYTLYRKIYLPSIIGMAAIIILGFLPSVIYSVIVLTFVVLLGINFNKWYINYAKKQIQKIKSNNPNAGESELINLCSKKGGTNIWLAIIIYVIFVIVSNILNPNVSKLYNNLNEETNECYVSVENGQEFLLKINELSNKCDDYEVVYDELKYVSKKQNYENYDANINKIYYSNKELKYIYDTSNENSQLRETHLVDNKDGKEQFLFIFHEIPVKQNLGYYVILFDSDGNVKFLKSLDDVGSVLYDETKKELSYHTINSEVNLQYIPDQSSEELSQYVCDSIKGFEEKTLYSGTYNYRYNDGEMELINVSEIKIEDLKRQYNCD